MTINQLHKTLGKLIAQGHGRRKVCIDKPSFTHPFEDDGLVIQDVEDVAVKSVMQLDDDGGTKEDSDGREVYRTCAVLYGWGDHAI